MEQGSAEWFASRLGKVTASRVADVVTKTKTGYGASRANYAAQLVLERLTGAPQDTYMNDAMRHGVEQEPVARQAYADHCGWEVETVGLVPHPKIANSGASPDGYVGEDGMVEIKCPQSATHVDTLLEGTIAGKYITQMQWQMACAGRKWCDFVSFDPRMPATMQLYVQRIERDNVTIDGLEKEVVKFLGEVDDTYNRLVAKFGQPAF